MKSGVYSQGEEALPSPSRQRPGRPHLERDAQQWIFDYVIQQSGLVYHWWTDVEVPMPKSIRSHAMISKHLGRAAQGCEAEANQALDAKDNESALRSFFRATMLYMRAQHTIFETNAEKRFLYEGLQRCFEQVRALNSYPIERVEAAWNGVVVSGYLHLCPEVGKAPLLLHLPGCDVTCESWPNPLKNGGHEHLMHVFSFDGPGQGRCNIEGIPLRGENYERAAIAMLDELVRRPEIDASQVVVYGPGMGSFWALRLAALDHRIKAVATKSTYADLYYLMNEESPRWKQLFAYMTQSSTEDELDERLLEISLDGYLGRIACPTLMSSGEYNLRDPAEEVLRAFDALGGPGELWIHADQFQRGPMPNGESTLSHFLGWLRNRIDGLPMPNAGKVLYLEPGGTSPESPAFAGKRHWYDSPGE